MDWWYWILLIPTFLLVVIAFSLLVRMLRSVSVKVNTVFSGSTESVTPLPTKDVGRDHDAYTEKQKGIENTIVKSVPKMIIKSVLLLLIAHFLTGYFTDRNSERLARAGTDLVQGDYGSAMVSLFSVAKPEILEQSRIATGTHSYLDKNGLYNFTYIGKNKAIMTWPYSTQDHDEKIEKKSDSYGNVLTGFTASRAIELCEEKFEKHNGKLMSLSEWKMNRSHSLGTMRIDLFPKIPEWTRDVHKSDDDDYLVIAKESGVKEWAEKKDIDREENGLYIDSDKLPSAGFRCSISWKDDAKEQ